MTKEKYNIGLVLSGGGVRGFAHLGAIKALSEHGIIPEVISGTSAGAVVAALYADGYTPDEIISLFNDRSFSKYFDICVPKMGLLKMSGLYRILTCSLKAKVFEDLNMPIFVCATNLNKGKSEYFCKGELLKPLLASSSIPVLFPPIEINGDLYNDGGVLDNLPLLPIIRKSKKLIGVFVNPVGTKKNIVGLKSIAERSFQLSISRNIPVKRLKFDLFIEPDKLSKFGVLEISKIQDVFSIGYEYTSELLEKTDLSTFIKQE
ncbi:MAG: patatin-like phospholipase family protein [Bacteroidota bacterium]